MASKKNKYKIENKEALVSSKGVVLRYSDVLEQVLMSAGDGVTTLEIDVRLNLLDLIKSNEKSVLFNKLEEVQFVALLLSKFKFSVVSKELVELQKELNNLLA